jgi:hypothetical protein
MFSRALAECTKERISTLEGKSGCDCVEVDSLYKYEKKFPVLKIDNIIQRGRAMSR